MTDKPEEYSFKIQKHTLWKFSTFVLLVLFVISLLTGGFGIGSDSTANGAAVVPTQEPQAPPTNIKLDLDDDGALKGSEDAEVTIIEFSDFECPFCGRFYSQTLPQILRDYVDTGKVNLIFKDFPLPFHPSATKAAIAAECAKEQGKFWEMHDKIFDGQQSWANQGPSISVPLFKQYAKDLGLNSKFDSCLDSDKYAKEVQEDTAEAGSYVSGTPSFFIGNQKTGYTLLVGAQPFPAFQQAIEEKL